MWLSYAGWPERWWTQEVTNNTVNCTDEELEEFVIKGRMLVLNILAIPEHGGKVTDQGIVSIIILINLHLSKYRFIHKNTVGKTTLP